MNRLPASAAAALAVLLISSCSGSGGAPQRTSAPPAPRSTTVVSTPPSLVPTTSEAPSPTGSSSASSTVPTPTVTPSAQSAVDAYIAFYNASTEVDRDPKHVRAASLDQYLTGNAQALFDGIYASMKEAGQAYRGTPPNPRLKVLSVISPTAVLLTSCPVASKNDPYTEYYVATGKAVPTGKPRNPPPPYLLTLTMKNVSSHWKLSDVLQDTSKTCSG